MKNILWGAPLVQHSALFAAPVAVDHYRFGGAGGLFTPWGTSFPAPHSARIPSRDTSWCCAIISPGAARRDGGGILAAYMSTMGTQLNWGVSYLVK